MRTFNAISIWFFWSVTFLMCLLWWFIRVVDTIPAPSGPFAPGEVERYTRFFWFNLATMTTLASLLCFGISNFWYRHGRPPGIGFWFSSLFLFVLVLAIPAGGFAPYFAVGDRSALQWVSLVVAGVFLVICFPRLPKSYRRTPPPIRG
jgi:hypothetical protein